MVAAPIVLFDVHASIQAVKQLSEIVSGLREQVFRSGHDFGVIPGTGDKPTLLLPGMEKLMRALRLRAEYHAVSITEDFTNGLFAYRYECRLIEYDTGLCVSTAIGSCNSKESKYRWRNADRVCPSCGKSYIIKGKEEYGGGWLCFVKKGGCGSKFKDGDQSIEGQQVGRIENPDIFDQVNTIDKIAQKRALGSAIKGAATVSEHFTVDLEDLYRFDDVVEGQVIEVVEKPTEPEKPATPIATNGTKQAEIVSVQPETVATTEPEARVERAAEMLSEIMSRELFDAGYAVLVELNELKDDTTAVYIKNRVLGIIEAGAHKKPKGKGK
jgi:hypothetical protein